MLYHYTQLKNLSKIFSDKNVTFRMYDSRWMNDPSESKVLQDYIIQYQEQILAEIPDKFHGVLKEAISISPNFTPSKTLPHFTYVLSFSSIRDSNIFWGSKYSGLNGFALTMDGSFFVQENFNTIGYCNLEDVYYFNSIEGEANSRDISHVARKLGDTIFNLLNEKNVKPENIPYVIWDSIISFLSIFHKHPSWSHEREKRFVIITKAKTNFISLEHDFLTYLPSGLSEGGLNLYCEHSKIDFNNNLFPRPYIEIELPKTTVSQITLGPNLQEIDIEAVRNYFFKTNYVIKVLPSGAQIR